MRLHFLEGPNNCLNQVLESIAILFQNVEMRLILAGSGFMFNR